VTDFKKFSDRERINSVF